MQLEHYRHWLMSADSKEELAKRTLAIAERLKGRYKPLDVYEKEGNVDIKERAEFLIEHAQGVVLDIGSYDGFFTALMARKSKQVVGIDMLKPCTLFGKERLQRENISNVSFVQGFAEELPFGNAKFDTAVLTHTLEHVFDDEQTLREAYRVTRPGGSLIVLVPPDWGNDPTHVRCVLPDNLEKQLKQFGDPGELIKVGDGIGYCCKTAESARLV